MWDDSNKLSNGFVMQGVQRKRHKSFSEDFGDYNSWAREYLWVRIERLSFIQQYEMDSLSNPTGWHSLTPLQKAEYSLTHFRKCAVMQEAIYKQQAEVFYKPLQ